MVSGGKILGLGPKMFLLSLIHHEQQLKIITKLISWGYLAVNLDMDAIKRFYIERVVYKALKMVMK
jgi:hypothetical protein